MRRFFHHILLILLLLIVGACGKSTDIEQLNLQPEPVFMHAKEGRFQLSSTVNLRFEGLTQNSTTTRWVTSMLRRMHFKPNVSSDDESSDLTFTLYDTRNDEIGDEGFLIDIEPDGVRISANSEAGLFYACHTLYSLMPDDLLHHRYRKISIPCGVVLDYPSSPIRKAEVRASQVTSIQKLKHVIDSVAVHRCNRLVLYLCDSSRWIVESAAYSQLDHILSSEDVETLQSFAASRHVELLPALDNMLDCKALSDGFPSLFTTGERSAPKTDSLTMVCCRLIDEMMERFPSDYLVLSENASSVQSNGMSAATLHHTRYNGRDARVYARLRQYLQRHGRQAQLPQ